MKLLFVGLDGLSYDVFEQFDMPFLEAMSGDGVRARFMSFEQPYMCTGPVWASVQTGIPPQEHGVTEAGAGDWHTAAYRTGVKTIWRRLNEKGLRCGVVNFPVTYPLRPVDPFIVCGFPAPWEYEGTTNPWGKVDFGGDLFWPQELAGRIGSFRSAWMNYIPPDEFEDTHEPYNRAQEGDQGSREYMMALLYRSIHETERLTHALMQGYEVDLLAAVFMETDTIGHLGSRLSAPQRSVFLREADDIVRDLVMEARAENVVVMSDHGCWDRPHTREGVFFAFGPAFAPGCTGEVAVLEVAPTLLYAMGVYEPTLPQEPAYRLLRSGQVGSDESARIQDRLRAMGYID